MTSILLVGLGEVGMRAARQLADTPGVKRLLLAGREFGTTERMAEALGPAARAEAIAFAPGDPIPDGVDAVATALPTSVDHAVIAAAIAQHVPAASCDDDADAIDSLRALDRNARAGGVTIAVGCGLAPGLADVLAKHAASSFRTVDEVRVARTGWAGPASVAEVRHARRALVRSWHQGAWREEHPHGEELVWFPEPIGARDCKLVTGGTALLADSLAVPRATALLGEPPKRTWLRRRFGDDGEWGAARVDVWGRRDDSHDCVVYGVIERTAVAAGTVLAVTAAQLAGALDPQITEPGVHGLGSLVDPAPFLAELAQRGVRAARFEGVPVR